MKTVSIHGTRLEYVRLPSAHPREGAPAIVFLHEGLGSISMWRDFPQKVADATGCEAVVYSRAGYGRSDPATLPRAVSYMHDEGLAVLPALLAELGLDSPILFGHSDGGSISLLCAGGTDTPLAGVIVMAPHVLVEDVSVKSIAEAGVAWATTDLPVKLGKHHQNVEAVFRGWNDIWLHPEFRAWNIEDYLPRIQCPVLAIQGEDDEYGTMEQIDRIAAKAKDVELVKLADCRHSPHKDQPQAVIDAVLAFVERIVDKPATSYERVKRIRFSHCDPAGIVFYPRYVELFNEVVEDWFADGIGIDFHALHEDHGLGIPTVRLEVEYLAPSRYGDLLTFRLRVAEIGNASLKLEISASAGEHLRVRAQLKVVLASMETLRPVPITEEFWRPKFAAYLKP
ncbi:MAG: alpha/beta fold hydrolase [Azoarcus sp.]|nr:alpha/beta fold hydrolase [Azoarcus sp.]